MISIRIAAAASAVFMVLCASPAFAQASRTWVSGVGDDANPCSRTAPCKTFAGAISKTATGGQISVLDPGGYGAVTITKSISIVADGDYGSITASGTNGIIVNVPGGQVNLRGLDIDGLNGIIGGNGIRVLAGIVQIEDSYIHGFRSTSAGSGDAILIQPSSTSRVHMRNVSIFNNNGGVNASQGTSTATLMIDGCSIHRNILYGLNVDGASVSAVVTNSSIFGSPGVQAANGGKITSYGNNLIFSGAPTSTVPLQ